MIKFTVRGVPVPQGSMRSFIPKTCRVCGGGTRAIITSDNAKLKQWRNAVRAAAIKAIGFEHPAGKNVPIRVEALFFLPRAKSNKAKYATKKIGDVDKLLRAALDSMSNVLYEDDAQVVEVHAFKDYGEPRAEFRVEEAGIVSVPVKYQPIKDADLPFAP